MSVISLGFPIKSAPLGEEFELAATQLRDHLRRLSLTVPFYKDAGTELGMYPIVNKQIIRSSLAQFLAEGSGFDRGAMLSLLRAHHLSEAAEIPILGAVILEQTSGSSGLPFRFPRTRSERLALLHGIWQMRKAIDPQIESDRLFAAIHRPENQARPNSMEELLAHLRHREVRWLHAGPRFWQTLAGFLCRYPAERPFDLIYLENAGGVVSADVVAFFRERGFCWVDQYGCREVWAIGYRVDAKPFMPCTQNVIVELLDSQGKPITALSTPGRVVVTSIHQQLFPFVRYDTGDIAELAIDSEGQVGFVLVSGHSCEWIRGLNGVSGTLIFKGVMDRVYRKFGYPDIQGLQIRQLERLLYSVAVTRSPHAPALVAAIAQDFNALRLFREPAKFLVEELPVAETQLYDESKPFLFTNKYARVEDLHPPQRS